MTEREALKLALSTLNEVRGETFRLLRNGQKLYAENKVWDTVFAIREVLEQPDQKPSELDVWKSRALQAEAVIEKFMAQPEQTVHREMQPIKKPICWANINKQGDVTHTQNKRGSWAKTPLYTSPPNYKPLTSEEYSILAEKYTGADGLDCVDYGRAIARHYGIKE